MVIENILQNLQCENAVAAIYIADGSIMIAGNIACGIRITYVWSYNKQREPLSTFIVLFWILLGIVIKVRLQFPLRPIGKVVSFIVTLSIYISLKQYTFYLLVERIINIRPSWYRYMFIKGILMLVRRYLYFKTDPWTKWTTFCKRPIQIHFEKALFVCWF